MAPQIVEIGSDFWPTDASQGFISADQDRCIISLDALFGIVADTAALTSGLNANLHGKELPCRVGYVICHRASRRVEVIAAPMGLRQIFWKVADNRLLISSSAQSISTVTGLSAAALFHYVYFHCLPGPLSAYSDVFKLDQGHRIDWSQQGHATRRYWQPAFREVGRPDFNAAKEELHSLMSTAVSRSLSEGHRCGAFLSGGLDSSTVAGFAAKAQPGIPTVSMGFDAQGFDEMEYARIASRHFGTKPLEYYVTPDDVVRTLPNIAAAFAEPFGNASAAAAYHCARIAKEHGLDTLLAGDGGDEIFGGNERYAKQMVFERYLQLPGLVRSLLAGSVIAAAGVTEAFPIGKAKSYIQQASTPLPDRLQSYNFLHRLPANEVFDPLLLQHGMDIEMPLHLLREEYRTPAVASQIDRMLFLDWKFTLHDNDLVKVNAMCDLAGVRVAYPMLDQSLVDFSMRLPSDWKVHRGELRWFYKKAMSDFLPHQIINKSKHGFGLPFGTWMRTHAGLTRIAEDSLHSLATRRYFQKDFLMRALRLQREDHASYYGVLVWILTTLELWLQKHMPNAAR